MRRDFSKKVAAIIMAAAMSVSGYAGAGLVLAEETESTTAVQETESQETTEAATEAQTEAETEAETETDVTTEAASEEMTEAAEEGTEATTEGTAEETTGEAAETEESTEETTEDATEETTEEASYKTDFTFENDEVMIVAKADEAAELPENAKLVVKKLQPGSAEFEKAKQASMKDLGTADDADYQFYDVEFYADGNEIEVADGLVTIQMTFKTVSVSEDAEIQSALHIKDTADGTVAKDVTANAEAGSAVSSVEFQF